MDAICGLVDRVVRRARCLRMRLGLEPCNRYETHVLDTVAQTAEIIESVGSERMFLHLDTYHMSIERKGMAEGFADAGEHLGYVHLSESNPGVPRHGMIDRSATFEAMSEVGYNDAPTIESFVHAASEIASGLAIRRPVAARPEEVIEGGLPFLREKVAAG